MADMDPKKLRRPREQSAISFPYADLLAAIEVAQAIFNRSGTGGCELHDLADDFGEPIGGAFRLKTSAARIFDLIEKRGRSEVRLTEGGRLVLSPEHAEAAKVQAFLRVPLYAAVYYKYNEGQLPHRRQLEQEMKTLGVPAKQVDKARQIFERSARQAGLFDGSDNKLIFPKKEQQIGNTSLLARTPMMDHDERFESFAAGSGLISRLWRDDPLIVGLIERLPSTGSPWSDEARVAWLRLANSIFNVTYGEGSGKIEIAVKDSQDNGGESDSNG